MKEIWLPKRKDVPLYGSMSGGGWPGFTKYSQLHDFGRFVFLLACLLTLDQITGIRTLSDGDGHTANQGILGTKLRKICPCMDLAAPGAAPGKIPFRGSSPSTARSLLCVVGVKKRGGWTLPLADETVSFPALVPVFGGPSPPMKMALAKHAVSHCRWRFGTAVYLRNH